MATISELYHYPVKGCAGVRVPAGVLGVAGLAHDRRFLVTDPAGTYRSQRRDPLLATIQPVVDAEWLTLSASLGELNARITARGGQPVPMSRFRPNIVVDGWHAHEEDRALRLTVGEVELGFAKPAIRCVVTMVDQHTGARSGPEPLRTLASYRRAAGGVAFGAKYAVLRPGVLAEGDVLTTTERADADLAGLTQSRSMTRPSFAAISSPL